MLDNRVLLCHKSRSNNTLYIKQLEKNDEEIYEENITY